MEFVVCILVLLNIFFVVVFAILTKKIKRLETATSKFESLKLDFDTLRRNFSDPKVNFKKLQEALKAWGDSHERNDNG